MQFNSQNDIDNFANQGYCKIKGDVYIGVGYGDVSDITDLTGLNEILEVEGNLSIVLNHNLQSLVGLKSLSYLNGDFLVTGNTNLQSLQGLENLKTVTGDVKFSPFIVYGGPSYDPITQVFENSFTNLTGLESLEKIGGDLILQDNRLLSSLDGLENLNSINGSLKLHDCDLIENLVGFKNIELINEGIEIGYNYNNLKNFEGLERISKTNSIYVYRNHSLVSF